MIHCEHENFVGNIVVNRLTDTGRFQADIAIHCKDCGTPFRFLGLPVGLDLNGAAVSPDGTEARLAILPQGAVVNDAYKGPMGFAVKHIM